MKLPGGMYCAMVTPLKNGDIDEHASARIVRGLRENGFAGVLVAGSTGEGPLLLEEQLARLVEIVVGASGGDLCVIAGTSAPATRQALRNCDIVARAGAEGVLVLMPFYFSSGDVDAVAYYRTIAAESPLPVLAYNLPRISGQTFLPQEVRTVSGFDNLVGYKDSAGNVALLQAVLNDVPDDFAVFQGLGTAAFPSLCAGVHGVFSATSSMIPELDAALFTAFADGDFERCRRLQAVQITLSRLVTASGCPVGVGLKAAMAARGICGAETLYPSRATGRPVERLPDVLREIDRLLASG